ncbi:MAG: cysteine--tRNA ligase [Desulfovibrio sp.]|nr:cysteine--tRNA ligase [Desulfovibrio sp.]
MQIFNTLSRKKEPFIPAREGKATLYVCGITAYDLCHIGHARSALVFDVLVRQQRHMGLEVCLVRNFTDVDDKIINRANKENRDWREVAQTHIDAFHEDMDRLGVKRADKEPKATEHISQIQALCSRLIETHKAYVTPSGDVYFRVHAWESYGKLSGRTLDDMMAGARVTPGEEKEDPLDFALWKSAKPGEPFWESPWGKGRPGWHIECSAMSQPYLPLDIHGGGQDLVFPHHENEIAQSEAAFGCTLAHYWVHNGFVQINAEKMSKSLGNFKNIRDILENYLPETLRFFLLNKHYRSPVDFTWNGMDETEKAQQRVYTAMLEARKALLRTKWKKNHLPADLLQEWDALSSAFDDAMNDDINTAEALGHVFAQVHIVNHVLEEKNLRASDDCRDMLSEFLQRGVQWKERLGLFGDDPETFLKALRLQRAKRCQLDMKKVNDLLTSRLEARAVKDFSRSDALRDELAKLGVSVRDTLEGQTWDLA